MSSYLSFYIVPKRKSSEEPKKHILLLAFSRSSYIYQYFNDNVRITWIGNNEETPYTTLTMEDIHRVLEDISSDMDSSKRRLVEFEKYAAKNSDYVNEIISLKEYISELQYVKHQTEFIALLLDGMEFYEEIEEVCCNIG
mgnify:CR=1 FL=1|jgi:hypothetical protein